MIHAPGCQQAQEELHNRVDIPAAEIQQKPGHNRAQEAGDANASRAMEPVHCDAVVCAFGCRTAGPSLTYAVSNAGPTIDDDISKQKASSAEVKVKEENGTPCAQASHHQEYERLIQKLPGHEKGRKACHEETAASNDREGRSAELRTPAVGNLFSGGPGMNSRR